MGAIRRWWSKQTQNRKLAWGAAGFRLRPAQSSGLSITLLLLHTKHSWRPSYRQRELLR